MLQHKGWNIITQFDGLACTNTQIISFTPVTQTSLLVKRWVSDLWKRHCIIPNKQTSYLLNYYSPRVPYRCLCSPTSQKCHKGLQHLFWLTACLILVARNGLWVYLVRWIRLPRREGELEYFKQTNSVLNEQLLAHQLASHIYRVLSSAQKN